MGRPPTVSKPDLIDAARRAFEQHGIFKATVEDIAKASGVRKSSLYYYFPGRQAIVREVLEDDIAAVKRKVESAMAREKEATGKLRAYVLARMRNISRLARVYAQYAEEFLVHYAFIHQLRVGHDRYEVATVADILRQGTQEGVFAMDDPDLTAFAIVAACKGLEYDWTYKVSQQRMVDNVDALLKVLFGGLLARPHL
jgi:AcrR family transcriptional regulator